MRVAIAEDSEVYLAGLVELLTAADVEICFQARNGRELLDYLAGDVPDAVLLDIRMDGKADDGLVAAEIISQRYPDLGILLLSSFFNDEFVRRFFANGTAGRGYLLKESFNDIEDVRNALNLVHRHKSISDAPILDRIHGRRPTLKELLTPRELDVLRLLADAFNNAAIARELRIKEDMVEYATQAIYNKLGRDSDRNPRVNAAIRWLQERYDAERPGSPG